MRSMNVTFDVVIALAVCLVVGCSSDPTEEGGVEPGEVLASETIGPDGGTISVAAEGILLVVPAGALTDEIEITIETSAAQADGMIGAAYRFLPEGLSFATEATLTLDFAGDDLPSGTLPTDIAIARRGANESTFGLIASAAESDAIGGDGSVSAHISGFSQYVAVSGAGVRCNGVFGLGPNQVWAFCSDGRTFTFDGALSAPQTIAAGIELMDGWGRAADSLIAVGFDGRTPYFSQRSAATWAPLQPAPSLPMVGVDGATDCAVAVGANGRAMEGDLTNIPAVWQEVSTNAPSHLWAVKVFDDCSALAVGAGGYAERVAGSWSGGPIALTGRTGPITLRSVWGLSRDTAVAVGFDGSWAPLFLEYDGTAWTEGTLPATAAGRLLGVWGTATDLYITGASGLLLRRDAQQMWTAEASNTTVELWDIWAQGTTAVAAVGDRDTFVYLCEDGSNQAFCVANTTSPPGPDAGSDAAETGVDLGTDTTVPVACQGSCASGQHLGGDGTCVPAGTCVSGYQLDGAGACEGWTLTDAAVLPDNNGPTEAELVALPDGRALMVGGSEAYLYDPGTNAWTVGPTLSTARTTHTATLLGNGSVLVVGGYGSAELASTELWDPSGSAGWVSAGSLASARWGHTATVLGNGDLLVAGGMGAAGALNDGELYSGSGWQAVTLGFPFMGEHGALGLSDGRIFAGNYDENASDDFTWQTAFYSASGVAASTSLADRRFPLLVELTSGDVLAAGGLGAGFSGSSSVARFDPSAETWTAVADAPYVSYGDLGAAVQLDDGRVMFTVERANRTLMYDPSTDAWSEGPRRAGAHIFPRLVKLVSGDALVIGSREEETGKPPEVFAVDCP